MANYSDKANAIALQLSGGGSGSGETNYVTNGSGAVALDRTGTNDEGDWIDSNASNFTASVTTTSAELPREFLTTTAIKFKPVTTTAADYVRYRFQIGESDKNRKLKIQWVQRIGSTYANDDFKVELYNTDQSDYTSPVEVPLSGDDTSGDSFIKASDGSYINTFSSDSNEYYELRFVKVTTTAVVSTDWISLNDIIVGPGQVATGAVVTEWTAFTVALTNFVENAGSTTGVWRRVGENLEVAIATEHSGAGAGGDIQWSMTDILPVTANRAKIGTLVNYQVGTGTFQGTNYKSLMANLPTGFDTRVQFAKTSNESGDNIDGAEFSDGDRLNAIFSIPITEWADTGTINLGTVPSVVTPWTAFTPVIPASSFDTDDCSWRRVGESMELQCKIMFDGVTTTAAALAMTIPEGLTSLRTGNGSQFMGEVGTGGFYDVSLTGNARFDTVAVYFDTSTTIAFSNPTLGQILGTETADDDRLTFTASIPIAEWAGGSQDTATVGFGEAANNELGLVRANSGSGTAIQNETWNGTAPTSLVNSFWEWQKVGSKVTMAWRVEYSSSGTGNSSFYMELPIGAPTPRAFGSAGVNNHWYIGDGGLGSSAASAPIISGSSIYSAGGTLRFYSNSTSISAKLAYGSITYQTDD